VSRLSNDELDDIRARNPLDVVAGHYVTLRRNGGRLVGPCPMCGGSAKAQRFEIRDNGESWVCAVCLDGGDVIALVEKVEGCDFRTAIERLGGRLAIDPDQARKMFEIRETKRVAREKEASRYREAERLRLWKLWSSGMRIHRTPAAIYLESVRGVMLPADCPGLRYLPSVPYWHGEEIDERSGKKRPKALHTGHAMGAAFIRADGHFGGLHLTWLTSGAVPEKLELTDPETGEELKSRKMRGSKTGAHIAVAPVDAPQRLVIGEGIETVLSVYTAHRIKSRPVDHTAFWAAGDLGNMAGRAIDTVAHPALTRPDGRAQRVPGPYPDPDDVGLTVPDSVTELVLLGDGDSEPVLTQYAMERAARRYRRAGREIRIAFAQVGTDFNNMLRNDQ
jgi:hypothetical protein